MKNNVEILEKQLYLTSVMIQLEDDGFTNGGRRYVYSCILNYKDAPFDICVMGKDTTSRGTKVVSEQNYYQRYCWLFLII
jgi:hypothetical protein